MQLADSRILIVNDDGIEAYGLSILEQAARQHSDDVWVVAPASDQSGRGRAMSYGNEVEVESRGAKRFAVEGTPSDCVLVALNGLISEPVPALVLSGVNNGANLGDDVGTSGTVGACLESAEQGVPAIAFSQGWGDFKPTNWAMAEALTGRLLPALTSSLTHQRMALNVNFPALADREDVAGLKVVHTGWRVGPVTLDERETNGTKQVFYVGDLREDAPNEPSCDLDMAFQDYITVTPLTLDQTYYRALPFIEEKLRNML